MEEQRDRRNRNIGLITSAGVHTVLLLLFLFSMAWRAPDPPLPEFGIELNFGVDNQGSGDIQPESPPASDTQNQDEPKTASAEAVQEQDKAAEETKPEVIASEQESVVPLKEEKEKVKETEKPKEPEKAKVEPKTEAKAEKASDSKQGDQPLSHGDDSDKKGDKGNPEGKLDAKALYGKQGGGAGGDGMSLNMGAWTWAEPPQIPDLPDNDGGRVEFYIECDEQGDITTVRTLQRGLSVAAEKILTDVIRRNSLEWTAQGTPQKAKGTVVFVLKTK